MNPKKIVEKILGLDNKNKIKFIVLFGSVSRKENHPLSDIDIALFYEGNDLERFKFRAMVSGELSDKVDIQIFQDLPLTVKKEVIGGKVLYYKDYQFIFDEVMKVIKEFDSFSKYYSEYFREVVRRAEA